MSLWRILAGKRCDNGPIDPRRIRSILIVRLDEMGDFVLFSGILGSLRRRFPSARITLVLSDWVTPLAELCPYIDEVVPFPTRGPKLWQYMVGPFRALRVRMRLHGPFDLAVNPRFDRDIRGAAFVAGFSLAPFVAGYPSCTELFKARINRGYDVFYTHLFPATRSGHQLDRNRAILDLLAVPSGRLEPELWLSQEDREQARAALARHGWQPGSPLIALGINARAARRRWPIESFVEVAKALFAIADLHFLVLCHRNERVLAEAVRPVLGSRMIDLAGETSLRVSAAALEECLLYVGNDSGPKHLAAALGKPVIEISCHPRNGDPEHFQSPERFAALTRQSKVLSPSQALVPCRETCVADRPHCIRQVSPRDVLDAIYKMMPVAIGNGSTINHL